MKRATAALVGSYRDRGEEEDESSSDEEEHKESGVGRSLRLQASSDEEEEEATDGKQHKKQQQQPHAQQHAKVLPPRPSALPRRSLLPNVAASNTNRRRSSARFINLGGNRHGGEGNGNNNNRAREHTRKSLAIIEKEAIRMSAENKINPNNAWTFKLIENLDRFLIAEEEDEEDDDEDGPSAGTTTTSRTATGEKTGASSSPSIPQRVNFTKASCSLDASVKIYGHRVDYVYLTSYKVLANLHRSDANNKKNRRPKNGATEDGVEDDTNAASAGRNGKQQPRKKSAGPTLEANSANINLNKLDSAFDIDPLFHKMSKNFDEGGAKGLLLVNLGTGNKECNIVFDTTSSNDDDCEHDNNNNEDEDKEPEEDNTNGQEAHDPNQQMVDISSLQKTLATSLGGQPPESFSLVSQLESLRIHFSELDEEGFIDPDVPVSRTQSYAVGLEEEQEADRSIHQEALERSRASMGMSFAAGGSHNENNDEDPNNHNNGDASIGGGGGGVGNDDDDFAADDFGGYDDDDFDDFMVADQNGERLSAISLTGSLQGGSQEREQTSMLLDAVASGKVLGNSQYEYLDRHALSQIPNNSWAGAAHWRPSRKSTTTKTKKKGALQKNDSELDEDNPKPKTKKNRSKKAAKERKFVDFTFTPDLTDILRKPPKPRGRNRANPLQFSKAVVDKYTNCDNLLPMDAQFGVEKLTCLFLRPNAFVNTQESGAASDNEDASPSQAVGKTVVFDMDQNESFGAGGGDDGWDDDGSFGGGGDDDGPGFHFAEPTNFGEQEPAFVVPQSLEDVRRVDKISVQYATVAKKVDVKRLKQDLWTRIGSTLDARECPRDDQQENASEDKVEAAEIAVKENDAGEEDEAVDEFEEEEEDNATALKTPTKRSSIDSPLSFYNTIQEMEQNKKQPDVSFAFYFICVLHLANEKELRLESKGLDDFCIFNG